MIPQCFSAARLEQQEEAPPLDLHKGLNLIFYLRPLSVENIIFKRCRTYNNTMNASLTLANNLEKLPLGESSCF